MSVTGTPGVGLARPAGGRGFGVGATACGSGWRLLPVLRRSCSDLR